MLCVLTALFAGRVLAQALVALFGVSWLPPMPAWYSGLLPYPVLLPLQLAILVVQVGVDRQVWRGRGFFARPRRCAARALRWLAFVYALSMAVRLAFAPSPAIPVLFHWALAAYLLTLGRLEPRATTTALTNFIAVAGSRSTGEAGASRSA